MTQITQIPDTQPAPPGFARRLRDRMGHVGESHPGQAAHHKTLSRVTHSIAPTAEGRRGSRVRRSASSVLSAALAFSVSLCLCGPSSTALTARIQNQETQERRFFVAGYVKTPGSYRWVGEKMTANQAIQVAGGIKLVAAKFRVQIIRKVDGKDTRFYLEADGEIQPGDVVQVEIDRRQ